MTVFAKKYGLSPNAAGRYLAAAKAAAQADCGDILNFEKYGIFTHLAPRLAAVRDEIAKDPDNILYCHLLRLALLAGDVEDIGALSSPNKEMKSEVYDTLPLFSLLALVPDMTAHHREMGLPEDVIYATRDMFENQLQDFISLHHRVGIAPYVSWLRAFLECRIIRVGRFNLEICNYDLPYDIFRTAEGLLPVPTEGRFHRTGQVLGSVGCEDERGAFDADYRVEGDECVGYAVRGGVCTAERVRLKMCERVLTRGERVVSVHIPSGGPLSPEECTRDLLRGREIFSRAWGDFSAFFCLSWLLDPQLEALVGEDGNIARFARRFTRFPIRSSGGDVFEYVYLLPPTTQTDALPVTTRLSAAVKGHLLAGGHIYGSAGIFLKQGE